MSFFFPVGNAAMAIFYILIDLWLSKAPFSNVCYVAYSHSTGHKNIHQRHPKNIIFFINATITNWINLYSTSQINVKHF